MKDTSKLNKEWNAMQQMRVTKVSHLSFAEVKDDFTYKISDESTHSLESSTDIDKSDGVDGVLA